MIVNLGCGTDQTGLGIDINYNPDIRHDLNNGIPLGDNTASKVLAIHVLEHLDNPTMVLNEIHRVLQPDGTLELEVPNVGWLPVRAWVSQDQHAFWEHKNPDSSGHWLARRLGRTESERTPHRTLWTKQLLADYLERAGFEYTITGHHWSRNLNATATLENATEGPMLHTIERETGTDHSTNDYWAQTRARVLTNWVTNHDPDSVLDVGCGSGYVTRAINQALEGARVTGIDTNPESIELARSYDSDVDFEVYDAFELRDRRESFDVVVFADVLEHFTNPNELLRQANAVLRPGGCVVVSVPAYEWLWGPHDEANNHVARYSPELLTSVAEKAGFRVVDTRYTNFVPLVPYYVYQRVLEKPIPTGARGSQNRVIDCIKHALVGVESVVSFPMGITLIGELTRED